MSDLRSACCDQKPALRESIWSAIGGAATRFPLRVLAGVLGILGVLALLVGAAAPSAGARHAAA